AVLVPVDAPVGAAAEVEVLAVDAAVEHGAARVFLVAQLEDDGVPGAQAEITPAGAEAVVPLAVHARGLRQRLVVRVGPEGFDATFPVLAALDEADEVLALLRAGVHGLAVFGLAQAAVGF